MSENDKKIHLKIITHEKIVYDDYIDSIYVEGENGSFGILYDHTPLMSTLKIGITRVIKDGVTKSITTMGGVFQIKNNEALILTSIAELDSNIDATRAKEAKDRAEMRLNSSENNIDRNRAEIALAKAIARLVATSGK